MAQPEVIEHDEPAGAVATYDRQTAPAITPMQMLQIAVEQNADIDKLAKLMDLQERWEANQARKAYVEALNAFKVNPPTIRKDKSASFGQGKAAYDYATLAQVSAVIGAALSEHRLSHRWEVEQPEGGAIRVTCVLTHEQGHSERVTMQAGADQSGSKNSIQAIGSTVTYLERYTLLAVTGLAAKGQDDDGGKSHDEPTIDAEQKQAIIDKMREVGADTTAFLKYLKVPTIDELPAREYARAMQALAKKAEKPKEQ